jgi:hypothetical protein
MDAARFRNELRRYWDEIARGEPAPPSGLDPELAAIVRRVHALHDVPPPDPAFAKRLEERLMATTTLSLPLGGTPDRNGRNAGPASPGTRRAVLIPPQRGVPAHLVTALLVLIVVIGSVLAFGVRRPGPKGDTPAILPAISGTPAPPAPDARTEGVLETIDFGIAEELPEAPVSIRFDRIELPPGASSSSPASELGLGAYVIESGTVTFTPTEDIELFQDGQPHGVTFGGDETELAPGEGFVLEPNMGGEVRNDGTEPVVIVVIRMLPGTPEEPASAPGL